MTWWHQLCMDNINQEPPAASLMDIKTLMCARFVPSYLMNITLRGFSQHWLMPRPILLLNATYSFVKCNPFSKLPITKVLTLGLRPILLHAF